MSNRFEKLMMTVRLIDKASGPASKITGQLDRMTNRASAGLASVAVGAASLFSTGYTLRAIMSPAIEMDRAIGELKSLDVHADALKRLEHTGLITSIKLGENAADIVRSAYDIQSAIAGLTGFELSSFTTASAVLAKGTKSDVATITDYIGTMHGIFEKQAGAMGKSAWIEQLAGQTATAVQMFKTTGVKLASAFSRLGATGESFGRSTAEQMAVLGTLQATMSGSEAATKYTQFLLNVGKAQDELGIKFTDSQGRMLGVVEILDKLRGKFGETLDVAEMGQLKNAFGSSQIVPFITGLINKTDSLSDSIAKLDQVTGMDKASKMAAAIADPWEKLAAAGTAVRVVFGRVLQPVINPLIDKLTAGGVILMRWTELFPNITRVMGSAVLTVLGLVAAISAFAIIGGIAKLVTAGWGAVMLIGTGIIKAWRFAVVLARVTWLAFILSTVASGLIFWALGASITSMLPALYGFTAALLANPITWIVLGVVALIGGLVALAWNWEKVSAAVKAFTTGALGWLLAKWKSVRHALQNNDWLRSVFSPLALAIGGANALLKSFSFAGASIAKFFNWKKISESVKEFGSGALGWLLRRWQGLRSAMKNNDWLRSVFSPLTMSIKGARKSIKDFSLSRADIDASFNWRKISESIRGFGDGALDWLLSKWQGLRSVMKNNNWLRSIFSPLTMGIKGARKSIRDFSLSGAGIDTSFNWRKISESVRSFGDGALDWLLSKWQGLRSVMKNNDWLRSIFSPLALSVKGAQQSIRDFSLSGAGIDTSFNWRKISESVRGFGDGALGWLLSKWNGLRRAMRNNNWLRSVFSPLTMGIKGARKSIRDFSLSGAGIDTSFNWRKISESVRSFGDGALDWLLRKWQGLRSVLGNNNWLRSILSPLTMSVKGAQQSIKDFSLSGAGIDTSFNWRKISESVRGFGDGALGWLLSKWNGLRSAMRNNNWLRSIFSPLTMGIKGARKSIRDFSLSGAGIDTSFNWRKISESVRGFGDGALGWLLSKWNGLRSAMRNNDWLRSVLSPLTLSIKGARQSLRGFSLSGAGIDTSFNWIKIGESVRGFGDGALDWLLTKWNGLRSAMKNNDWLRLAFSPLASVSHYVGLAMNEFKKIPVWWDGFIFSFSSVNPFLAFSVFSNWLGEQWEAVRQMFSSSDFIQSVFSPLSLLGPEVDAAIQQLNRLPEWWENFKGGLSGLNPFEGLGADLDSLLNKIPSFPSWGGEKEASRFHERERIPEKTNLGRVEASELGISRPSKVPKGGLANILTNNNGTHIDKVEVNTTGGVDGYRLADQLQLAGG